MEYQYFSSNKLVSKYNQSNSQHQQQQAQRNLVNQSSQAIGNGLENQSDSILPMIGTEKSSSIQIPLTRQYVRSFFPPDTIGTSQQNYFDSENASFKILNSETKLIKQVLESNHVSQVPEDAVNWSLLWSCSSLNHKHQMYDALSEN